MIEQLPSLTPDTTRNARTIARCHDTLNRRRAGAITAAQYVIERNTLLGFGALYLSSLAFDVIRILTVR
jgi:hypothetical protein